MQKNYVFKDDTDRNTHLLFSFVWILSVAIAKLIAVYCDVIPHAHFDHNEKENEVDHHGTCV